MEDTAGKPVATKRNKTKVGVILVTLFATGFFVIFKNRQARHCRQQVVMMEVAALEYHSDQGKGLPTSLEQLCPRYLSSIPNCPVAGVNTYQISATDSGLIQCSQQPSHDRWLPYPRSGR
jgi:hypothetical protein